MVNRLGHERARQYPNCRCYELMSDLKPKHKNSKIITEDCLSQ